jgi:cysteinyl-tRNA synthetase
MPDYGALSNRNLEEQQAGARVAVEAHKRNPGDFVLWKLSNGDEPGWDSPWGRGRPGWHIECSAMSERYLGEVFDIHGGGLDLIFPHHENEIAQSRCAHGTKVMANVWMHNGFLQVEGQKMSKSLGNFVTINELLKDWPGEVLRFNMLRTHYRQPIDWTNSGLQSSIDMLDDFYKIVSPIPANKSATAYYDAEMLNALEDDLNTHAAITVLHKLRSEIRGGVSGSEQISQKQKLTASANLLGLLTDSQKEWFTKREAGINRSKVDLLVIAREKARTTNNWAESDRIRSELEAMGVAIKDNKDGTTSWEVKR